MRGGVLVAAGVICLLIAGGEIVNAVDTLHSAAAGAAGVDAGVGSNGAAARRDAITGAVLISCLAVLAAVLTEAFLPRPLGLLAAGR